MLFLNLIRDTRGALNLLCNFIDPLIHLFRSKLLYIFNHYNQSTCSAKAQNVFQAIKNLKIIYLFSRRCFFQQKITQHR